jgi:hypothetical protein
MFQKEERGIAKLKEEIEKAKMKADRKKTVDWLNDVLQHRKNFREFHEKVNPPLFLSALLFFKAHASARRRVPWQLSGSKILPSMFPEVAENVKIFERSLLVA